MRKGWLVVMVLGASVFLAGCGESAEADAEGSPQVAACVEQCEEIEKGLPWCFGEGWSLECRERCEERRFAVLVEWCEDCRAVYGLGALCDGEVCPDCWRVIWD